MHRSTCKSGVQGIDYDWRGKFGNPYGSTVKNLPAVQEPQETRIQSLGQEEPLEGEMAAHSSILAHGQGSLWGGGGYSPWGCKELDTTEAT